MLVLTLREVCDPVPFKAAFFAALALVTLLSVGFVDLPFVSVLVDMFGDRETQGEVEGERREDRLGSEISSTCGRIRK